jgi:hypothetical protein
MEPCMKHLVILVSLLLISCSNVKAAPSSLEKEKKIYKSWVLSRCLSTIQSTDQEKQDALNSASAYLEQSSLPVEAFTNALPLITEFISKDYRGSIQGSFNTMKCVDLFYSDELNRLFIENYKHFK